MDDIRPVTPQAGPHLLTVFRMAALDLRQADGMPAAVIALLAAAVLRWRVTSAWVVIGGALLGWPLSLLG